MKYLTILNFNTGTVHQYEIGKRFFYDAEDFEEFIDNEGFSLGNVQWMVHDTSEVIYEN